MSFSITPLKAGLFEISYSLSGQDAKDYKVPDNSSLYVKSKEDKSVYKFLGIPEQTLPIGCYNHTLPNDLLQCQATLTSSHSWGSQSLSESKTEGIVHLKTKNTMIPLSMFGTSEHTLAPTKQDILNMIQKMSTQHINSSILIEKNGKCEVFPLSGGNVMEFVQTDAFPKAMLASLSRLMPKWIHLNTDKNNNLFDVSNLLVSIGKPPSHGPGSCENLPESSYPNTIYYKPSVTFEAQLNSENKKFDSNESACFAVDVCKSMAFVDFSQKARKSFGEMTTIQNMKESGWDFGIASFGIRKQEFRGKGHYDLWIKGVHQVYLKSSHLNVGMNLTGEVTATPECLDEVSNAFFT